MKITMRINTNAVDIVQFSIKITKLIILLWSVNKLR